ncbi:hypothetical protein D210916BOD24_17310 [Alteromonas sp. D210916BOD_24]|uniref:IspD/TarI family cytidylyltransferase n=1 Tax=Alteromonas sp. D210916BOD_24 TaxID=3157618 RepID=UPI00399C6E31
MYRKAKVYAVILAGGQGSRFGDSVPKQFLPLDDNNCSALSMILTSFRRSDVVDNIIIVCHNAYHDLCQHEVNQVQVYQYSKKPMDIVNGGKTRQQSTYNGIKLIDDPNAIVLIHDGARPFVSQEVILQLVEKAFDYGAVNLVSPSVDTMVSSSDGQLMLGIADRRQLWRGLTPQAFRCNLLTHAHHLANKQQDHNATCDCSLVQKYTNQPVSLLVTNELSPKITYPHDIELIKALCLIRDAQGQTNGS